jgi:hypothetical protein
MNELKETRSLNSAHAQRSVPSRQSQRLQDLAHRSSPASSSSSSSAVHAANPVLSHDRQPQGHRVNQITSASTVPKPTPLNAKKAHGGKPHSTNQGLDESAVNRGVDGSMLHKANDSHMMSTILVERDLDDESMIHDSHGIRMPDTFSSFRNDPSDDLHGINQARTLYDADDNSVEIVIDRV